MPSVMNIKDFMGLNQFVTPQAPKQEPKRARIPLLPWDWDQPSLPNPVVENATARINALQQHDEPDEEYCRCRNAATRQHHVTFDKMPLRAEPQQEDQTEDTASGHPTAQGTSEMSGPMIQVPRNACIPMASNCQDKIVYQWLQNEDLETYGLSWYDDQEIIFDMHHPIDMKDPCYAHMARQAPAPDNPGGGGDGNDDQSNRSH